MSTAGKRIRVEITPGRRVWANSSDLLRYYGATLRRLAIPVMAGLLGLYIALHSPLRDAIAAWFGLRSRGCFFCSDAYSLGALADTVAGLVLIAGAVAAAEKWAESFPGAGYERPLVFGLGALAFIVAPAAALGWIGTLLQVGLLRPPMGPLLSAIPAVLVVMIAARHGWRPRRPSLALERPGGLVLVVGGAGAILILSSIILGLMHPATSGDALSYHAPLAVFLWRDGNLSAFLDRSPDIWALAHPGTAELWFGLLRVVGGEPLADLGQLPFALLGSAAVYAFARRLNLRQGAALLAASAFLLVPIVVMQVVSQPNDIVGAALLMTAMALSSAPVSRWSISRLALVGLGMGLVSVTKLALVPSVAGVGMFVVGALIWRSWRGKNWSDLVRALLVVGLAFLVVVGPWWMRNISRYGNPLYPAALPLLGRGVFVHDFGTIDFAFVPSRLAWPLYPALEPHDDRSGFGALVLVGVLPGLGMALWRGRRQPLLLWALTTAITLPAWWVMTLHEPRFLLGLVGLGFVFVPWSLLAVPRPHRRTAIVLVAAAAIFSMAVTFDQALLPLARQPLDRAEFYDRVWGTDPAALSLPESEGLVLNTGYAPTIFEYTAFYPLLGPSQSRLVLAVDSDATTDSITRQMRETGVRYAYVAASPDNRSMVQAIYDPSHFELVHTSTIIVGESSGARRNLLRPAVGDEENTGTRRYLFRLK